MKTYTNILLLLASSEAAYGHSAKSAKAATMSIELVAKATKGTKGAKSEPIRRFLIDEFEQR